MGGSRRGIGLSRGFLFDFVNLLLQRARVRRNFLGGLKPSDGILIVASFPFKIGEVDGDFIKASLFSFWSAESCCSQRRRASCQTFRARLGS